MREANGVGKREVHPGLIEHANGVAGIQGVVEPEGASQPIGVDHRAAGQRAGEAKLLEAVAERQRGACREPFGQFDAHRGVDSEHHVFAADVVEETAVRRSAAILRPQTAQAGEAQTESPRHADRAEVLNHADFRNGKPLRPRRDAKGDSVVERTVVA